MTLILKSNVAYAGSGADLPFVPEMQRVKKALSIVSTKLLKRDYYGPLLRVRRSSDGSEMDIGSVGNGRLDTAKLLTFVGSSNGSVSIMYDQSGDANNFSRVDPAGQPLIVAGGVLQVDAYGTPCLQFGANKALFIARPPWTTQNYIGAYIEGRFDKVGFSALNPGNTNLSVFSLVAEGAITYLYYRNNINDTLQKLSYNTGMEISPQSYFASVDAVSNKATIKDRSGIKTANLVGYVPMERLFDVMIGTSVSTGNGGNLTGYMTTFAITNDAESGAELMAVV